MRDEYDFSEAVPNPYAKQLQKRITLRLDTNVLDYFKALSEEVGVPYQSLINLYLRDCVTAKRKLKLTWRSDAE